MDTRYITIKFEVTEDITDDELHEVLCQVFHEDISPQPKFIEGMVDIKNNSRPHLHLHVWAFDTETWDNGPEEDIDFEWVDTYDDHEQYVATLTDGRHLELRLLTDGEDSPIQQGE